MQYAVGGAVQGVASGVVVSGGTVLTVVGAVGTGGVAALPGVGAVAATIALDAAVGVLVSTRAVAHVAAHHGYDVREPRERLFALGVLSLGLADDTRRAAAYRELAALAGGLARREMWRLTAAEASKLLLLGGEPFEERLVMWWNFVGRTGEEIADYAELWNAESDRFGAVVGFDGARLEAPPLPPVPLKPRGRER